MATTQRLLPLITALVALAPLHAHAAPNTVSLAEATAGAGPAGTFDQQVTGPQPGGSSAAVSVSWPPPGGGPLVASGQMEAAASFGALRARGTVRATGDSGRASVGAIFGTDPTTAALFEDHVLIGGVGPQVFQLHFALTGSAGALGPAQMQFAADLTLQAWGTGITVIGGPAPIGFSLFPPFIATWGLSVNGTAPQAFGLSDFLLIQAAPGSTLNLQGGLGGHMSLQNPPAGGVSEGVLNLWNTAAFSIVPVTAGTTFSAASGHDYLATPVPEPAAAVLLLGGWPLLAWALRRRRRAADPGGGGTATA